MKRQREVSELEQLHAENERLKDKIKIFMLERNFLQKRLESGEIERQLSLERSKQKLAEVENEKLILNLECERLRRLNGGVREPGLSARSNRNSAQPAVREPSLMLPNYSENYLSRNEPSSINYNRLNDHDIGMHNYLPVTQLGENHPFDFLKVGYVGAGGYSMDSTEKISERTRGKRKKEARRARDVKIEPRVVCRENPMGSPATVEDFNVKTVIWKSRSTKGKIPSKKALILLALKALGGEGTLDDLDKWVKKNRYCGFGKMDRRSLSNALCKLAVDQKLDVVKRKKNTGLNLYRIKEKTTAKERRGKTQTKKEPIKFPNQRIEAQKSSKEMKETSPHKEYEVIKIHNDKSERTKISTFPSEPNKTPTFPGEPTKIPKFPLSLDGCGLNPNYQYGSSVGLINMGTDIKSSAT